MPTILLPGPHRTLEPYTTRPPAPLPLAGPPFSRVAYAAAHVVADPLAERDPWLAPSIDWDTTLDYRLYLWSLGLGVAEATEAAQRGAGLDWPASLELIRRSVAAAPPGAALVCGAGTDHLPPGATLEQIAGGYEAQCESIERAGGKILLLPSRALAAVARSAEDYWRVYDRVLGQLRSPAIVEWLGEAFDPALAGYGGHIDATAGLGTLLTLVTGLAAKIDGVALGGFDATHEVELRRRLPRGVRLYTGDPIEFPGLIAGDDESYSHAMLAAFDAAAPAAAAALGLLQRDDLAGYEAVLAPTVALARSLIRPPTGLHTTGLVFMAYLNGHQSHFAMIGGRQSARSLLHLADLFRLADAANLLRDPDDACARMGRVLALAGVV